MCEYCGCQQVPAIAALTAEHDELRALARDAGAAARWGDRNASAAVADRLVRLLRPHTEIEECAPFPAMAGEFAEHVASLQDDHHRIERTLTARADPADNRDTRAQELHAVLAELFTHILREQDGLFPAALSVLAPAEGPPGGAAPRGDRAGTGQLRPAPGPARTGSPLAVSIHLP